MDEKENIIVNHYSIPVDLFHIHYDLILSTSIIEAVKHVDKMFEGINLIKEITPGTIGYTAVINNTQNTNIILLLDVSHHSDPNRPSLDEIITHEIIHLSWFMLDIMNIKITADNHEIQAYLAENLKKSIMIKINNFNQKNI